MEIMCASMSKDPIVALETAATCVSSSNEIAIMSKSGRASVIWK